MEDVNHKKSIRKTIIIIASAILVYLLITIYFTNHYFLHTFVNGVDVSLKSHEKAEAAIRNYIKDYKLLLIERSDETEAIKGQDIGMQYNVNRGLPKAYQLQNPFTWVFLFFTDQRYYVENLYIYNKGSLNHIFSRLRCMNKVVIEPKNVSFIYNGSSYEIIEEQNGNKIDKDRLLLAIKLFITAGKAKLDLNKNLCYEIPKYTFGSKKTYQTMDQLNKYVATKITYQFGDKSEVLDGSTISEWLSVDDDLEVVVDKKKVQDYLKDLSLKYDTVGITRSFKSSSGKIVEVKGGVYGWKINLKEEAKALLGSIYLGEMVTKEPVYARKALLRGDNDIGNTYIEINITRQHIWFYKDGKLIASGSVVTGNPNTENSTVVGTYMILYKQKKATLSGPGYEAEVTYWMPFYGNMGIHDANWRFAFGGEIYKERGTHGCVNAPYHLAQTIFENVEEGTPVVIYKE